MLHFAYGANMHRAVMRQHAPGAEPVGTARLADFRFVITTDGYASVEPARGAAVYGVLWRLTPRDRVMLDLWENIVTGLYRAEVVPVRVDGPHGGHGRHAPALIYLARRRDPGDPKAGYMEIVTAAAGAWHLPGRYIDWLKRWLPKHPTGSGSRKLGDLAWM